MKGKEDQAGRVAPQEPLSRQVRRLTDTLVILAIAALAGGGLLYLGHKLRTPHPEPAAAAPSIDRFAAEPVQIHPGDPAVLRWEVKRADSVSIDQGVGKVDGSGSSTVSPSATTSYTLSAKGKGGDTTAKVLVSVLPREIPPPPPIGGNGPGVPPPGIPPKLPPPSITLFEADPPQIKPGQSVTLRWQTSAAELVLIDQGVGGVKPAAAGTVSVRPLVPTQYKLTAANASGRISASVSVNVVATQAPPPPKPQPCADVQTLLRAGREQRAAHDDAGARESFRKAAECGNTDAMVFVGTMASSGVGGPKDDAEAARWFRQAADAGNVRGMYNLGLMYENGRGVPKSQTEAANWYAKAANGGSKDAAYRLGIMHELGLGVPQDADTARQLYQKAGTPEAMDRLRRMSQPKPH